MQVLGCGERCASRMASILFVSATQSHRVVGLRLYSTYESRTQKRSMNSSSECVSQYVEHDRFVFGEFHRGRRRQLFYNKIANEITPKQHVRFHPFSHKSPLSPHRAFLSGVLLPFSRPPALTCFSHGYTLPLPLTPRTTPPPPAAITSPTHSGLPSPWSSAPRRASSARSPFCSPLPSPLIVASPRA